VTAAGGSVALIRRKDDKASVSRKHRRPSLFNRSLVFITVRALVIDGGHMAQ
jgi:hypothetical protein